MYTILAGRSWDQFLIRFKEMLLLERLPESFSSPFVVIFNGYGDRSPEIQRPVREDDSSCPSSIMVKNKWRYTSTHYRLYVHGLHNDSFNFDFKLWYACCASSMHNERVTTASQCTVLL
jgi:hypothetical protein